MKCRIVRNMVMTVMVGCLEMSYASVGRQVGVSRERARQIVVNTLRRLDKAAEEFRNEDEE